MLPYMAQTVSLLRAPARRLELLTVGVGWPQDAVPAISLLSMHPVLVQ